MTQYGLIRLILYFYKDDKGRQEVEILEQEFFQTGLIYESEKANQPWLGEQLSEMGFYGDGILSYFEGRELDETRAYELTGTFFGEWVQEGCYEHPEAEFHWEIRDEKIGLVDRVFDPEPPTEEQKKLMEEENENSEPGTITVRPDEPRWVRAQ